MKLLKQSKAGWQYQLNQTEVGILADLVKRFPFTGMDAVKMSRTDKEPAAMEREKLLKKVQEPGTDSPFAEITDEDIDNLFND